LILVRVALLLPSDDKTVSGFHLLLSSESFQQPKLPDYLSAVRLNLPKNTLQWLAFVGFRRFYPPGSGSNSSNWQAFA
jgi:hypothetical protein